MRGEHRNFNETIARRKADGTLAHPMNLQKDIRISIRAQAIGIIAVDAVWFLLLWAANKWVNYKVFNRLPDALLWAETVIFFCFPFIAGLWTLILFVSFFRLDRRHRWWVWIAAGATLSVWLYTLSLNLWKFSHGPEMIYW
jgi:hypothetical protein